uniref:Putative secreted protein n=1 Tax=Anopheles darlingi TaxID=43151 RepID=A0A2M4DI07_ANODA
MDDYLSPVCCCCLFAICLAEALGLPMLTRWKATRSIVHQRNAPSTQCIHPLATRTGPPCYCYCTNDCNNNQYTHLWCTSPSSSSSSSSSSLNHGATEKTRVARTT